MPAATPGSAGGPPAAESGSGGVRARAHSERARAKSALPHANGGRAARAPGPPHPQGDRACTVDSATRCGVMRILTVTHYQLPHWGGIEMTARGAARALSAHGARVGAGCRAICRRRQRRRPGTIRVPASDLPFDTVGVAYPLWGPRAAAQLREAIDWCDVVNPHDCLYPGTVLALRYAAPRRQAAVLTQHAGPWPFYRSRCCARSSSPPIARSGWQCIGGSSRRCSSAAPCRHGSAPRVRYPRPPRFITNGVDTALFSLRRRRCTPRRARERLGLPLDRRIVLYVGRFLFMKGLPVIEALARRDPDTLFVLIGAGPIDPRSLAAAQRRRAAVPAAGGLARLLLGRRCPGAAVDRRRVSAGGHGSDGVRLPRHRLRGDLRGMERRPRAVPASPTRRRDDASPPRLASLVDPARSRARSARTPGSTGTGTRSPLNT